MITLTRLNGTEFALNEDLIEFIDVTPDSVISMESGRKVTVKEPVDEVIEKIVRFKKKISLPEVRERD